MTSLAKVLDASMRAAARVGPKVGTSATASVSATPATSGASGPTTTRSTASRTASSRTMAVSVASTATQRATSAMPALPGAQTTSSTDGDRASAQHSACSRPPLPRTSTLTRSAPEELSPAPQPARSRGALEGLAACRTHRHPADRHARQLLEPVDVGLRRLGQVRVGGDLGEVLAPSGQLLVDRLGVVEDRLVRREVLELV